MAGLSLSHRLRQALLRWERPIPAEAACTFGAWELVDRYAKRGIIKGYILYRLDPSRGELNAHRPGMDSPRPHTDGHGSVHESTGAHGRIGKTGVCDGKNVRPAAIDWSDNRSAVGFVQTDGDNVRWFQGTFFRNPDYWSSPDRGRIPFGWSCCFAQLAQLCPPAVDHAFATRSPKDSLIEWGGGYYYPDHFGSERADRWALLARQVRRTWALMKKTHTRIIGFNFSQHDSSDTRKAYARSP